MGFHRLQQQIHSLVINAVQLSQTAHATPISLSTTMQPLQFTTNESIKPIFDVLLLRTGCQHLVISPAAFFEC